MLWLGPASSLFDLATYVVMYFIICPMTAGGGYHQLDGAGRLLFASVFQAGWFVESMWSQTLVIHMIRTQKLPFIQSRASAPVCILTLAGIAGLTVIPFTPAGPALGLAPLPGVYFLYLAGIVLSYMFLITGAKKLYIRRYGSLL